MIGAVQVRVRMSTTELLPRGMHREQGYSLDVTEDVRCGGVPVQAADSLHTTPISGTACGGVFHPLARCLATALPYRGAGSCR